MSSLGDTTSTTIPLDLQDEITSLNSIYADGTLQVLSPDRRDLNKPKHGDNGITVNDGGSMNEFSCTCLLSPPAAVINPPVELTIGFGSDYPNSSPVVLEGTTNGKGLSRGEVARVARDVLGQVWVPGVVVMFELVEALKEVLHRDPDLEPDADIKKEGGKELPSADIETESDNFEEQDDKDQPGGPAITDNNFQSRISWATTPTTTVQRSVFIGRAVRVTSVEQAKGYVEELLATDKKVAKATHNITAWRIKTDDGVQFQDNDDDGETAAGSRLAHLLELIGIWNVMVVVSRWYGGVKLGPDRFRIINQVAREALDIGGFVPDGGKTGKDKGKSKGK